MIQVFNIPPQVNDQLVIGEKDSINIPNNTFMVNVTMSNEGGKFKDVPFFLFGKKLTSIKFYFF